MPIWVVVVIVVVLSAAFVVAAWLLSRRSGVDAEAIKMALDGSTAVRLKEELEAEQEKTKAMAAEVSKLAEAHRQLAVWYTESMSKIDKEARDAFDALAVDADAVDRKLDQLLGTGDVTADGSTTTKGGEGQAGEG